MIKKKWQLEKDCWLALKYVYYNQISYKATALAFMTLLTIVPFIAIIIYCFTTYFEYFHIGVLTKEYVAKNFLPDTNAIIMNYLATFTERAFRLSIFNILFFFISAIWLVISIEDVMLSIWQVPYKTFNFISFLIYTFVVLIFPLLLIAIALVSYILTFLLTKVLTLKLLLLLVPLSLNMLVFSFLYFLTGKAHALKWKETLCGSLIAAILLEFSKTIFTIYINYFSNYELIYGAISILPVFVLWIYIFWLIALYGAVIVKIQSIHSNRQLNPEQQIINN